MDTFESGPVAAKVFLKSFVEASTSIFKYVVMTYFVIFIFHICGILIENLLHIGIRFRECPIIRIIKN